MGKYDVSTQAMQSAGTRIASNAQDIKSDLNRLGGQLGQLDGGWHGEGKAAFTHAHMRYEAANRKLHTTLDQISALVLQNQQQYTHDDASARSGLTASSSSMDVSVPGL